MRTAAAARAERRADARDDVQREIRRALAVLCEPGDVIELRVLNAGKAGTISGYYNDLDILARDAARLDACGDVPGQYITANPVNPVLWARAANRTVERAKHTTSDSDIIARRWLLIDLDPVRPAGVSSTDAEHDAALALSDQARSWLVERGIPRDSIVAADSGNGAHLLVRVELPNDPDATALCRQCLAALDLALSTETVHVDTATYNAARIWKLYGTTARKGDSTQDRPHRRAALLDVPARVEVAPRDVWERLAALAPTEPNRMAPSISGPILDVAAWLAKYGLRVASEAAWNGGRKWILSEWPVAADDHGRDRAAFVVQLPSGAIAAGCQHARCTWSWRELRAKYEPDRSEPGEDVPPLDVFGDATLVGSPDLPRDALPSVIADYAVDEAQRLGVDLAMLAMPCLVVCAAAIDDAFVVQPKARDTEWVEPARLWLGVVTEPGGRKTPALQKATAPLRATEQRWLQSDREELVVWKNKHDETTERPRQRRLIVDDATTEALSDILVDNSRGVLCVRDELSAWFGSFDAYRDRGGKDRGLWLELYNGGGKPVDRVKRGNIYVPNWSACLLGGIQPGPMRRLARKIDDDGLLQRFVVVFPQAVDQGVDRRPDYAALARYRETVVRLVDLKPGNQRVVFRLSDAAQAERALVERLAHNVTLLPETSAAFRAHLAKWSGLFARLVCTYHVTDAVADDTEPTATISGSTASQVARLMTEYLLPHAARFYTELLGQEHLAHARWLAGHILAHQLERITARDVGRVYRELRGDGKRIAEVMATLVLAGWATEIDSSGRPATRWRINPKVHQLFDKRAADERQRRDAVRAEIARAVRELGTGDDA
jgi:Protein of unknown function (DUF3987)